MQQPSACPNFLLALVLIAGLGAGCSTSTVEPGPPASADSGAAAVSDPAVREALMTSCYGCHSDRGSDPWYARLAPSRWVSGSARQALNFSEWNSYPAEKRAAELNLIASVVSSGTMPPGDYSIIVRSARLGAEQKQQIAQWASHQAAVPAH